MDMDKKEWDALRARYRRELEADPSLMEFRREWLKAVGVKN